MAGKPATLCGADDISRAQASIYYIQRTGKELSHWYNSCIVLRRYAVVELSQLKYAHEQ